MRIYAFSTALLAFLLLAPKALQAQDVEPLEATPKQLSFEAYMAQVLAHHPVSVQAELSLQRGDAALRQARGAFDPKAYSELSQKYFDDKKYYSLSESGLKVPTWFGIDVKAGYDQNQGTQLNPENKLPNPGLWYAGISVPLGQGLWIDKRRAMLRQAQLFQQSTEVERLAILNELLYQAGGAYWEWFQAYGALQIFENALTLAQVRFNAVKRSAVLGDKPPIDTLEAGIQVQNRRLSLQQAQLDLANARARLSVFLWLEGQVPLELEEATIPVGRDDVDPLPLDGALEQQIDVLVQSHPELRQYDFKIQQLEVERRLKREMLKPQLNLQYNALAEPINNDPFAAYSESNYKWGLDFSMPIFLRKERGALQQANIKLMDARMDFTTKSASLAFKARASLNTWSTTNDQALLYSQTVRDYSGLLAGERRKFNVGESSLFLVNKRELSYINAQLKLLELLAKNRKASLASRYALGILASEEDQQ